MNVSTPTPRGQPNVQQVQERAYAIYLTEGSPDDRADEHWRLAEEQLRAELRQAEAQPASPQPVRAGRRRK
jgi:hypothetical protein